MHSKTADMTLTYMFTGVILSVILDNFVQYFAQFSCNFYSPYNHLHYTNTAFFMDMTKEKSTSRGIFHSQFPQYFVLHCLFPMLFVSYAWKTPEIPLIFVILNSSRISKLKSNKQINKTVQ